MESHPGKELIDHLHNVAELGQELIKKKIFRFKRYNRQDVEKLLEIVCLTHDFGKATSYFQRYLKDQKSSELTRHGLFSAIWTYFIIKKTIFDEKLACFGYFMVYRHHGDLKNFAVTLFEFDDSEKKILLKQLEAFDLGYIKQNLSFQIKKEDFTEVIEYLDSRAFRKYFRLIEMDREDFLLVDFLYSLLLTADKGDAIFYDKGRSFEELKQYKKRVHVLNEFAVDDYKKQNFGHSISRLNTDRESIYQEVQENILKHHMEKKIFSINVPTGMGKTLTSLNAALKLRKSLGRNAKIIYALPFTSIIDQNFAVFQEVLGNPDSSVLIKDHHLADKKYIDNKENILNYDISEYLIENWDSEVIVTTFYQLLHSLFTNRNRSLKKFYNIANSIIILDEVQSIPHKYWSLIRETFKTLSCVFDCHIILMTATLPLIFKEEEIVELVPEKKEYFSHLNRIELYLGMKKEGKEKISLIEFQELAYKDLKKEGDKSFLFVMNTIQSSLDLYTFFKKSVPDRLLFYLSSNIIPKHRLERIREIKMLKEKNAVIVSTQMIEAGVDIDFDMVYRDFGPLDSINQTAGRCNRNFLKEKGFIKLFRLVNEKGKEFSSFIYDDVLIQSTLNILKATLTEVISENQFYNISQQYFEILNHITSDDVSEKLLEYVSKLYYEYAFTYNEEEKDKYYFRLISEDYQKIDVFVEVDEEAQKIYRQYEALKQLPVFERKEEFNNFKKDFLSYIISIPKKNYYKNILENELNIIRLGELSDSYCFETGYYKQQQSVYFL